MGKVNWSTWYKSGTKKKIWVPDRNGTHELMNTRQALYPQVTRTHGGHLTEFMWHFTTHNDFSSADPNSIPFCPGVLIALWIERPPIVREIMDLIPVRTSDYFFVPRSCHVDQFTFHMITLFAINTPQLQIDRLFPFLHQHLS